MGLNSKKRNKKLRVYPTIWSIIQLLAAIATIATAFVAYLAWEKINTVLITGKPNVTACIDELTFGGSTPDSSTPLCSSNEIEVGGVRCEGCLYKIKIDVVNLGLGSATDMRLVIILKGGEWKDPSKILVEDDTSRYFKIPEGGLWMYAYGSNTVPLRLPDKVITFLGPQQKMSIRYTFEVPEKIPEKINIRLYGINNTVISEKNVTIKPLLPPAK